MHAKTIVPLEALAADLTLAPEEPGVYLLLVAPDCGLLELSGYRELAGVEPPTLGGYDLAYVGSGEVLRRRLKAQLLRTCHGSTLRQTLGALLQDDLKLTGERRGPHGYSYGHGERRLTKWLKQHGAVCWISCDEYEAVETQLIHIFRPPLNLSHQKTTPHGRFLLQLRRDIRRELQL